MTIEIPLTKGQVTLVDDEDADLAQFKWRAYFVRGYANGGKFIAIRNIAVGKYKQSDERLHRVILSRKLGRPLLRSEEVDHIFGLTLDNRRSELRLATRTQNARNIGLRSNNTSGFKGVSWNKTNRKWSAHIRKDGKSKYLGSFDTPEAAHAAWWKEAQKAFGEFANSG